MLEHVFEALAREPAVASLANCAGRALCATGRLPEGEAYLRKAVELAPADPNLLADLGTALLALKRHDEAVRMFEAAFEASGGNVAALGNLAAALFEAGRSGEAIDRFRTVVARQPALGAAHGNLAGALLRSGQVDEALNSYRRLLELEPGNATAFSESLASMNYECRLSKTQVARLHRRYGERFEAPVARRAPGYVNSRDPQRRLRIGYVSADLGRHSVAYFLEAVLASHDPNAVDVHVYSNRRIEDLVTARLRGYVEHWHLIANASDDAAEQLIRAHSIDVLVDLHGHTAGNRLPLFARRPAPIQATWLGYPNTTGLTAVDYRITDAIADPPGLTEPLHTEELVRLPDGFLAYRPLETAPEVGPLPCLDRGYVCFASLNNRPKVGFGPVELWARLLLALPGSRLILKARDRDSAARQLRAAFESQGVSGTRVDVVGWDADPADHLAQYGSVDIALDTFPYAGTTTTCEALWMGVPVVTLAGEVHAGRVGASLLKRVGLPELVAKSRDEYLRIAVELANDVGRLGALRAGLRAAMRASPLLDGPRLARQLETTYRHLWLRWLGRSASA